MLKINNNTSNTNHHPPVKGWREKSIKLIDSFVMYTAVRSFGPSIPHIRSSVVHLLRSLLTMIRARRMWDRKNRIYNRKRERDYNWFQIKQQTEVNLLSNLVSNCVTKIVHGLWQICQLSPNDFLLSPQLTEFRANRLRERIAYRRTRDCILIGVKWTITGKARLFA